MKNLSKLGKALNKAEQKEINGGKMEAILHPNLRFCSQATNEIQCRQIRGCAWFSGPSGHYCGTTNPHIAL